MPKQPLYESQPLFQSKVFNSLKMLKLQNLVPLLVTAAHNLSKMLTRASFSEASLGHDVSFLIIIQPLYRFLNIYNGPFFMPSSYCTSLPPNATLWSPLFHSFTILLQPEIFFCDQDKYIFLHSSFVTSHTSTTVKALPGPFPFHILINKC